jgi:thioesterase domain-containing protein
MFRITNPSIMASEEDTATMVAEALRIIGEGIAVEADDLQDHETWTFLGLGTLLARAIAADLHRQLGLDVTADTFVTYPTVAEFRSALERRPPLNPTPSHPNAPPLSHHGAPQNPPVEPADPWDGIPKPKVPLSMVLQGDPATADTLVWLFPDGSGAGTAYKTLPAIGAGVCLVALNSPFLRQAHDFTCSVERMARLWFDEVRKLQPPGKALVLGGWSAGGYYSYEMTRLLTDAGYTVDRLILIDSPCRLVYEALPGAVVDELTRKGLMGASGEKKAPEWLVQHFSSTVASVERYMPTPLAKNAVPGCVDFIWVRQGLVEDLATCGLEVDLNVKVTRFLLEPRGQLKSEGWEQLLPGARYSYAYMTGNHFQITHPPHVSLFRS